MTSSLSAQTSNDCYSIRVKGLMYVFCVRSWNITLGTGDWGLGSWDLTVGYKDLGSGIWDRSINPPWIFLGVNKNNLESQSIVFPNPCCTIELN